MAVQLLPKWHRHEAKPRLNIPLGEEATLLTEGDLRPVTQSEVVGTCFAPIEGLKIVGSMKTDFFHHGLPVIEEPCAGMTAPARREGHPHTVEVRVGARIPGEVWPGKKPVDTASRSLIPPTPQELGIISSVDASYPDLRHLARGGPQAASR